MQALIAKILALFGGSVIQKVIKCIPAIVSEAEKAMKDGKIDATERKDLAWKTIDTVSAEFGIKVNGIVRWAIGWLIDSIAKKLPSKDIVIPDIVLKITKEW
jgi:hypothetical protein